MVKKIEFNDMPHEIDSKIKNAPKVLWRGATDDFEAWQREFRFKIISIRDSGWPGLKIEVWYDDFEHRAY